jgi:hypothetical protein
MEVLIVGEVYVITHRYKYEDGEVKEIPISVIKDYEKAKDIVKNYKSKNHMEWLNIYTIDLED